MSNSSRRATAELAAYAHCGCTHALERRRSALHDALERVVIFDIRFDWNGIGNSLPRWLALLRDVALLDTQPKSERRAYRPYLYAPAVARAARQHGVRAICVKPLRAKR